MVNNVQGMAKSGYKFLDKSLSSDTAAIGAAAAAGTSFKIKSSGPIKVRNNHLGGKGGFRF